MLLFALTGELLYLVGDTKAVGLADVELDDDDAGLGLGSSSRVITSIRMHVGEKTADHVLACLYIARSDNSSTVRQVALQVWKSIVSNTPRTLREIMPALVELLIQKLSSESNDQRAIAGRALGELVRKLGDHVLPLVVPYLQRGLASDDDELRQGVCLGLSEILRAASPKQIEAYVDTLVPALQQALCDDSDHVRSLAAKAFHALIKAIGEQATESVVPSLLQRIEDDFDPSDIEEVGSALQGLRSIVEIKPRDLLDFLLPRLLQSPLAPFAANTLGSICQCAGNSLQYHLSTLVPSLVTELISAEESTLSAKGEEEEAISKVHFDGVVRCSGQVVGAVTTQGVNFLVGELGKEIEHETDPKRRKWGAMLTSYFFANCSSDYLEYIPVLLKYLLGRSADSEVFVHQAVVAAISSLSKAVPVEELVQHVRFIRSCISLTASDAKHRTGRKDLTAGDDGTVILPLFKVPKSLEPILPVFIHAVMHCPEEVRENAAQGIGEIIQMTDAAVLKPFLVKTTGPLIRIFGERFPSNVKFAILEVCNYRLRRSVI